LTQPRLVPHQWVGLLQGAVAMQAGLTFVKLYQVTVKATNSLERVYHSLFFGQG